ncbi:zinc-binding dehydrogenase [Paucibacter soli]|uniref:zinc-binding dehydrogenase n=1 Tax=Paucibacter soli TaxID=3133433 RepID=UPI0030B6F790
MKAVVCQNKQLSLVDLPEPKPEQGQLLVKVLRCGICGSDLHVRQHCDHWGQIMGRSGYRQLTSSAQPVVFGHEFSAEVLDQGPGGKKTGFKPGTKVVALPFLRVGKEIDAIGLSERVTGAYAERVLVQESMTLAIPNGLDPAVAALTEPMSVAWHAIRRGEVKNKDVAIVIGCGPVGLATICLLKAKGVRHVVAADFSAGRRALAKRCGADVVVDPAAESPYANWQEWGCIGDLPGMLELALGTREQLGKLPLIPWWHSWRLAEALGALPKRPIIFECVGAPGVLQSVINGAPQFARIVVVGVCMQADQIEPAVAINKEVDLRFVLGYSPLEFRDTLHMMAEGKVDCAPLITGEVGLGGVDAAFKALGDPNRHAKILVDPASILTTPA